MTPVGRPPEVDSEGKQVLKCLVNVTIPTKLANFLKEKGINRSKLFTEIVGKMYNKELCTRCYNETVEETLLGWHCSHCENYFKVKKIIEYKQCENCEKSYNIPYNMFAQSKKILKGCWECIPEEERK